MADRTPSAAQGRDTLDRCGRCNGHGLERRWKLTSCFACLGTGMSRPSKVEAARREHGRY